MQRYRFMGGSPQPDAPLPSAATRAWLPTRAQSHALRGASRWVASKTRIDVAVANPPRSPYPQCPVRTVSHRHSAKCTCGFGRWVARYYVTCSLPLPPCAPACRAVPCEGRAGGPGGPAAAAVQHQRAKRLLPHAGQVRGCCGAAGMCDGRVGTGAWGSVLRSMPDCAVRGVLGPHRKQAIRGHKGCAAAEGCVMVLDFSNAPP